MSQQIESVKMALQELGINASGEFFYNPDYDLLIAHETSPELTGAARGVMTDSGAVAVDTGIFTGRSPRDKYIVRDEQTRDTVWWADSGLGRNDNKPLSPDVWRSLKSLGRGPAERQKTVRHRRTGAAPARTPVLAYASSPRWRGRPTLSKTCLSCQAPTSWPALRQTSWCSTARAAPMPTGRRRG